MTYKFGRATLLFLLLTVLPGWGILVAQEKEDSSALSASYEKDFRQYEERRLRRWQEFLSLESELKITREEYGKFQIFTLISLNEKFKRQMSGPRILLAQEMLKDKPDMTVIENHLKTLQNLEFEKNLAGIKEQIRYREILGIERWAILARFARSHTDSSYYRELFEQIYSGAGFSNKETLGALHMFIELAMLGLEPDQ